MSYTLESLPELTDAQIANLKVLAERPDSEIDFSDIPRVTEERWENAIRGQFFGPNSGRVSERLDAEVLAWVRRHADQNSFINEALRREMLAEAKQLGLQP